MRTIPAVARHKRKKRIMKAAKGFNGARKNQLRAAKDGVMRAMNYAFTGRKERKRQFRALWIQRINAAAREQGLSYSKLMGLMHSSGVEIDRKALADLAVSDPAAFARVVAAAGHAG